VVGDAFTRRVQGDVQGDVVQWRQADVTLHVGRRSVSKGDVGGDVDSEDGSGPRHPALDRIKGDQVPRRDPVHASGIQTVTGGDGADRRASSEPGSKDAVVRLFPLSSDPFGDEQENPLPRTRMVIVTDTGVELPLVASPATVAPILGTSDHGVRDDCIAGRIPTMPRGDRAGTHHRILVARLLDLLGIPYRIERVTC